MRTFFKHFFIFFIITFITGYILSIKECFENSDLEGSYFQNIGKTVEYFLFNVFLYVWWFYITILSMILALISIVVFKKLTANR